MSLDCRKCGACCEGLVVEVLPLDDVPEHLTEPDVENGVQIAVMREQCGKWYGRGPCIALKGKIGKACSCSIYRRRPKVCRDFKPGSYECLAARSLVFGASL